MSRLSTTHPSSAQGATSEIYASIKKAAGIIPNVYTTIGTHCPTGLKTIIELDKVIEGSTLSEVELAAIRLKVSVHARCDYCIAAYTFLGQFAGLSKSTIKNIRTERPTLNEKIDTLLDFVCTLMTSKGVVDISTIQTILDSGYTENNLIEICLVVSNTTFINLVNRINNTTIDFPQFDIKSETMEKKL